MKKKNKHVFLIGGLFGLLLSLPFIREFVAGLFPYERDIVDVVVIMLLYHPGYIALFLAWLILEPVCNFVLDPLTGKEWCAGLAFDGGPLNWLENIATSAGMIIGWGLLFLFFYLGAQKILSKKVKKKDSSRSLC